MKDLVLSSYGYVSVPLQLDLAIKLHKILSKEGIKDLIEPDKMHVTICYDGSNPIKNKQSAITTKTGRIANVDILGERGSKWEALVLSLKSQDLHTRHKQLINFGFHHAYQAYIPHLSIKYSPIEDDLLILSVVLPRLKQTFPSLVFGPEVWEPVEN